MVYVEDNPNYYDLEDVCPVDGMAKCNCTAADKCDKDRCPSHRRAMGGDR